MAFKNHKGAMVLVSNWSKGVIEGGAWCTTVGYRVVDRRGGCAPEQKPPLVRTDDWRGCQMNKQCFVYNVG
jgi:hypothetical protein